MSSDLKSTYTPSQAKAIKKYRKGKKHIRLLVDKDTHEKWTAFAKSQNKPLAAMIKDAVEDAIRQSDKL
jgi:hypothetical protein